jgi:hypothetical protein
MSQMAGIGSGNPKSFQDDMKSARILLYWTFWAMFCLLAGCVVPVAPDFQNPPKGLNYYPYLLNSDPVQGSTVTLSGNQWLSFRVLVGDQNLGDTLYVRWASDYPPFAPSVSKVLVDASDGVGMAIPPPTKQTEIRPEIFYDARCENFAPNMQQHRLVVIVSDRPFVKPASFSGDLRYNLVDTRADKSLVTYPIMPGWNVNCPP